MAKINWYKIITHIIIIALFILLIRGCEKTDEVQQNVNYWNHNSDSISKIEKKLEVSNDSLGVEIQVHDSTSKRVIDSLKILVNASKKALNQKIRDISGLSGRIIQYEKNNDTSKVYMACDSLMGELTTAHYLIVYYQEMVDTAQLKLENELSWRDSSINKLQHQVQGFKEAYGALQKSCTLGMSTLSEIERKGKRQALWLKIGWGIAILLGGKAALNR